MTEKKTAFNLEEQIQKLKDVNYKTLKNGNKEKKRRRINAKS